MIFAGKSTINSTTMAFNFDEAKALSAVLLILKKNKGKIDRHKLFKILYFADQKHIVRYGRPVIGDVYIAMKDGPVPSMLYDAVKSIDDSRYLFELFRDNLKSVRYFLLSDKEPDLDELSESDVECILESFEENYALNFDQLKDKSHGDAWNNSCRDDKINIQNIAKEGHASKEMLQYLNENIEDFKFSNTFLHEPCR